MPHREVLKVWLSTISHVLDEQSCIQLAVIVIIEHLGMDLSCSVYVKCNDCLYAAEVIARYCTNAA